MNDHGDLDARLARWFTEEAVVRPPDRLAHTTRERIAATDQIGRIRTLRLGMPARAARMFVLTAVGIAALAMVTVGSFLGLGSGPGAHPSGQATPRPSLTLITGQTCRPSGGTCLGPLPAGVFETSSFLPQVGYATPAGWTNTRDTRGQVDLSFAAGGSYRYPDGTVFHDGISLFRRPIAESAATGSPLDGVGKTAGDLARWLDANPDLDATGMGAVTIGGVPGWRITISLPNRSRTTPDHCQTDHGEPACASLFISDDPAARFGFGIVGPESAVIYLLDAPSGDTVMVVIDDVDGVDREALISASEPVVDSLIFPS